jgi:hypothetical protein
MSYCGKLISSENLPTNWKDQITDISLILKTLNVNSNDMLLRNICCFNGEIKIIDFGLCTIFGKTIDDVFPTKTAERIAHFFLSTAQKRIKSTFTTSKIGYESPKNEMGQNFSGLI